MSATTTDKLKELLLYIAKESENDENFGHVKLAKLLFYSDFGAYGEFGESITGSHYRKERQGPKAREQLLAERDLEASGFIEIKEVGRYMYTQRRVIAKRKPQIDWLTPDQLALVDEMIRRHWNDDASDISDLSHTFPGWDLAEHGEEIPYHTVFISREGPTQKDIDWGLAMVREYQLP